MIRKLICCMILGAGLANADQTLSNPCAQAKGACEFTGVSPTGIPFKVWNDKQNNAYITLLTPGKQSNTLSLTDIADTFTWVCPDLLEDKTSNLPPEFVSPDTGSAFIDFNTETSSDIAPDVFAVNCTKRVIAYENETYYGREGTNFVSPVNNLHQVINIDQYILTDQSNSIIKAKSYFDSNGNLVVTYLQPSNAHNPFDLQDHSPVTYKNVSVTIPINYNSFAYSNAIDCNYHWVEDDDSECSGQGSGS